jgi:hypothetical protein
MRKIEDVGGSYRAVRLGTRWYPVLVSGLNSSVPGARDNTSLLYIVWGREDYHVITAANYSRAYRTQVGFRSLKALRETLAPYLKETP